MDPTIEAWCRDIGIEAFRANMAVNDYVDSQRLKLDPTALYAAHEGWLLARDLHNGWLVN